MSCDLTAIGEPIDQQHARSCRSWEERKGELLVSLEQEASLALR